MWIKIYIWKKNPTFKSIPYSINKEVYFCVIVRKFNYFALEFYILYFLETFQEYFVSFCCFMDCNIKSKKILNHQFFKKVYHFQRISILEQKKNFYFIFLKLLRRVFFYGFNDNITFFNHPIEKHQYFILDSILLILYSINS